LGSLRVTNFGGIIPRLSDRALPDNNAQYALNAKLFSGDLRAWWQPAHLHTLATPATPVDFYFFKYLGDEHFVGFSGKTDVVRAPLINDAYSRLYWTNSVGAYVTTMPDVIAAVAPKRLGIPAPTFTTFTVVPTGGTVATAETRVYTVILVSAYGEEGPNSVTVTASGNADGTWTINGLNTYAYDTATYTNITKIRLYRTLTSSTGVDYRQVNEWTLAAAPAAYVDAVTATVLASSPVLESISWIAPPAGLQGLIGMAGGFMAGFVGKTIYFSHPYFPHAWPLQYQQAVEDDIVALGTYGNVLVVTTAGQPHAAIGTEPGAMSFTKLEAMLPNISNRSLVSTASSVLYASPEGLVSISQNGIEIVSKPYVTKDEWASRFASSTIRAAVYQDRYLWFYSDTIGAIIGFDDPSTAFTELSYGAGVVAIHNERFTGRTMFLRSDKKIYEWDGTYGNALTYTWRTKPFLLLKPGNFGAAQLRGDFSAAPIVSPAQLAATPNASLGTWAFGLYPLGGRTAIEVPPDAVAAVSFKLYVDDVLRLTKLVEDETPFRLPSGYKGVKVEIELSGSTSLYSLVVAATMKELEQVP
jgi:hypothetical protein